MTVWAGAVCVLVTVVGASVSVQVVVYSEVIVLVIVDVWAARD